MWFDVGKLIASANFQDPEGVSPLGGMPGEFTQEPTTGPTPLSSVPGVVPDPLNTSPSIDPLGPAAGPMMPGATDPSMGLDPSFGIAPAGDTGVPATPGFVDPAGAPTSTAPDPMATPGGMSTVSKTADRMPMGPMAGTKAGGGGGGGGGRGGAAGAANNPMAQFLNGLRGLGAAAQAGDPQSTQMMNMIRHMMRGGMGQGGMFGGRFGGMGGGLLTPGQMARLRMARQHRMNMLNQRMANQHRGVGRFGGRDYGRHVQNINNEMEALAQQEMDATFDRMLRGDQQALQWARFNQGQDQDYWERLLRLFSAAGVYGGAAQQPGARGGGQTPGTFAPATSGGADTEGVLP